MSIYTLTGYGASIDPDVPVGTVLHSRTSQLNGNWLSFQCAYVPGGLQSTLEGRIERTGAYSTWPSGVPGIGIRIRRSDESRWWPRYTDYGDVPIGEVSYAPRDIVVEFVKTGNADLNGGLIQGRDWWHVDSTEHAANC
ncbi:hypothetical protein [Burkholderia cenocepacia]|uniref:hypothetical protein n=1 Tax=Burkholderia cenocepacia TaxID=95486 RepID=UPI0039A486F8